MANKDLLKSIPEKTGVYVMYSKTGEVIYVGKSINLKSRISSYFSTKGHSRRIQNMVSKVVKVDFIVVNTESEALILEATLIKKHKPRYNVLMKDSKFYPFVKVSRDEFPYINVTRKYKPDETVEYFGPFTDSKLPHKLVDVIQRVFKLRVCRNMQKSVCLNYYIDRCSAPCVGKISPKEYRENVEKAKEILRGKVDEVINSLTEMMREEAKKLNFEKASFLRDSIQALRELENQKQYVFDPAGTGNIDYISFSESGELINFYVAHTVDGKFFGKESITLSRVDEENPLERFLSEIYLVGEFGKVDKIFTEREVFEGVDNFFKKLVSLGVRVVVSVPTEEKDIKILELCRKNSEIVLTDHSHRVDMEAKELEELCRVLGLKKAEVIDGFDIANYGDEIFVGSGVRFVGGEPAKKYYRLFKIKSVEGQNDVAMLAEIVLRRYKKEKEDGILPDLILVDGGKGQLNSAISSLKHLSLNIPVIALAKQEEKIILPDKEIILPPNSYALRLLQRVRDEAHRFCNTFARKVKSKLLRKGVQKS